MDAMLNEQEKYNLEVEDTIAKIKMHSSENSLVIPIFTDLHARSEEDAVLEKTVMFLDKLSNGIALDAVLGLGDNLSMLGRKYHVSNERIQSLLSNIFDRVHHATNVPLLLVHGNHDGIGTDFFKADFWYSVVGEKYDQGFVQREGNSAYFYLDYEKQSMRVIALSIPCGSDINDTDPTPIWAFGQKQLKWLAEKALDVPADWDVLVLCHVPFFSEYRGERESKLAVWLGDRETEAFKCNLCGWIDDRTAAEAILWAYHEGKTYEDQQNGICADFSNKSGKLIACLSGHKHIDMFLQPGEAIGLDQNRLPCAQVVTASADVIHNKPLRDNIQYGVSLDVLVLNPRERKMAFIRLGDGEDRQFHYE